MCLLADIHRHQTQENRKVTALFRRVMNEFYRSYNNSVPCESLLEQSVSYIVSGSEHS